MSIVKKVDGKNVTFADKPIIDHNQLIGRESYGAHPISAIRKLPEKLTEIKKKIAELEGKTGVTKEYVDAGDRDTLEAAGTYTDNHIKNVNEKITEIETKAERINLAENQGELTFTNYNGEQTSFRSGYEVDNDTIQLKDDKISLKKVYVDNTIEGDGTEENPLLVNIDNTTIVKTNEGKLHTIALSTTTGTLTGDQINNEFTELNKDIGDLTHQLEEDVSAIDTRNNEQDNKIYNLEVKTAGMGGYLNANNFGDHTKDEMQSLLTEYAKQEIGVTEQSEIFNGTKVINSFDKHLWILTNTPTSDPAVFDWSDQGETKDISVATDDLFGLVKGSLEDLQGSIDANGHITINGLDEALLQKADISEDNTFEAVNTFKADTIFDGITEHNKDVNINNSILKITNVEKDIVTLYNTDGITFETNNELNQYNLLFPKKSGTIALTSDTINEILKHSQFKNADENSTKSDIWTTSDADTTISLQHENGTTQSSVSISKNYTEMSSIDTNANSSKISVTSATITLNSQSSIEDINNELSITPTHTTFTNKPRVRTGEDEYKDLVLVSDLDNYVPVQSEKDGIYSQVLNENGNLTINISENGDLNKFVFDKNGAFVNDKKLINEDQLAGKLNKLALGEVNRVYIRSTEDQDTSLPFTYTAEGSSIAFRNASGRLAVETPVEDDDAVNKSYLESLLPTVEALI